MSVELGLPWLPPGYCAELRQMLSGRLTIEDNESVNASLCKTFVDPNPRKTWREGTEKKSFNYLLLDPSITQNLPARYTQLSAFKYFVILCLHIANLVHVVVHTSGL